MFGVDSTELLIVAVLALLFIGPKELPTTMRTVGRWVGKMRGMARHFTSGFEAMVREAELEEMEKKWREENERIMREYPALTDPTAIVEPEVEPVSDDQPPLPLEHPQRELP
ncbi:twin-arginine translocase subunit TatB [Sphingomonas sinipercae]|uniref:Twin-arginine translocase subunit TatB n=1 Tax=Sphingomonas sinipercae TaxID=2714944 RepID=A0A6G7ZQ50_9SPHN|nr:Sec-independent protein translocase protein TatB [Sphingomonas sinipercae]QIL03058.1 twin-arginine translocase subunit TatB [Sphingomonas sinipercae]